MSDNNSPADDGADTTSRRRLHKGMAILRSEKEGDQTEDLSQWDQPYQNVSANERGDDASLDIVRFALIGAGKNQVVAFPPVFDSVPAITAFPDRSHVRPLRK